MQQMKTREEQYAALVQKCGVTEDLDSAGVFGAIEAIFDLKGEKAAKLENLLGQMHYSQLINFEYKFGITTTDSMI